MDPSNSEDPRIRSLSKVEVSPRTYAPDPITPTKLREGEKIFSRVSPLGDAARLESITCVKYERRKGDGKASIYRLQSLKNEFRDRGLNLRLVCVGDVGDVHVGGLLSDEEIKIFHWRTRNYLNRLLPAFVGSIFTCRNIYESARKIKLVPGFLDLSSRLVVENPWLRVGNLL